MSRRSLAIRIALAVPALGTIAVLLVACPTLGMLLVPAIGLALALAMGMFPGEQAIERLRSARRTPGKRRSSVIARPATPAVVRRVGRLLAFALAMRPPPARRLSAV
jgi:hypothetical protein